MATPESDDDDDTAPVALELELDPEQAEAETEEGSADPLELVTKPARGALWLLKKLLPSGSGDVSPSDEGEQDTDEGDS